MNHLYLVGFGSWPKRHMLKISQLIDERLRSDRLWAKLISWRENNVIVGTWGRQLKVSSLWEDLTIWGFQGGIFIVVCLQLENKVVIQMSLFLSSTHFITRGISTIFTLFWVISFLKRSWFILFRKTSWVMPFMKMSWVISIMKRSWVKSVMKWRGLAQLWWGPGLSHFWNGPGLSHLWRCPGLSHF